MTRETMRFPAADGYSLEGEHVLPEIAVRGAVVIASATAVPRRLYAAFAGYLAEAGLASLAFDYRGIGGSAPKSLKGFDASMHAWGEQDLEGAIAWLTARHPHAPLLIVGHSAGGQIAGLAPSSKRASGMLLTAAQSGYWRKWPFPYRWRMFLYWYFLFPLVVRILGYAPMKRLGAGENLPAGMALEWSRWCRHPEYLRSYSRTRPESRYESLAIPIRAYVFTDDPYAPRTAVEHLMTFYSKAAIDLREVSPVHAGGPIGHFGFYKERLKEPLWREAREFLISASSTHARASTA